MRRAVPLLLLASLAACTGQSDARPAGDPSAASSGGTVDVDPTPTTTLPAPPPGSTTPDPADRTSPEAAEVIVPDGFERVRATVTESDGTECELCLWLADDNDRRRRGLMFVTDLGPADGMAFVYPAPHSGSFWMKNTRLPLSIAFFGPTGAYLDAFDMEPCTAAPCRMYATPDDFLVAIETLQGGLADLGIAPGSTLDLTGEPCETTGGGS